MCEWPNCTDPEVLGLGAMGRAIAGALLEVLGTHLTD
jgi:hypothetical protein